MNMEEPSRRSKRVRVAVDYALLDSTGFSDCNRVQHKKLARAVLKFEEQPIVGNYFVDYVGANELAAHVHSSGFQNPCVVRNSDVPPSALGIRVPEGELTVERIADLVGRSRQINTIDVTTQSEGPVYTMQEWVEYFAAPSPRKPLLNVVSLDLASTSLQAMVSAPNLVKELDLADKAWPASASPAPKVQLYTLMSAAGCFMDFHIDFGGSSVWYHVLSGRKVFLVIPPIRGNLMAFEEWASSDKQASVFFADRVSGCQKLELAPGDTLLLPGGWPHCVVTPMDSIVLGGNFLTGYNLSLQLDIWQMEERLRVRAKFRFPLYKELMWHSASYYQKLLEGDIAGDVPKVSKWEKAGIYSLTKLLRFWLGQVTTAPFLTRIFKMKDGEDLPKEISLPGEVLVKELLQILLKDFPADTPRDVCESPRTCIMKVLAVPYVQNWTLQPQFIIKVFGDSDEEFDPEEGKPDDDKDLCVDDDTKGQRRPKKKATGIQNSRQRFVNLSSSPKTDIWTSQGASLPRGSKKFSKSKSGVKDRLLKEWI